MPVKTKKVLFTSHTANFQKFNRPFMRWFKQQGYEVHYASMGEEEVLDCDKHFTVPFERSPFKLNNIKAIKRLKKVIDHEEYDIIHTHTPMGSVVTRLAAIATRKRGTRVIYTAHGFHFFKGAPIANWLIYYPVEKLMARFTDTLITINKEDYDRAKKRFKTDVQYMPGVGVDLTRFNPISTSEKADLRRKYKLQENDFIFICAAELNKNKNQELLIRHMPQLSQRHPHVKLMLCGEGDLRKKYQGLIDALKLQNTVYLMGYRNDIEKLFQLSDVCVAASKREGLGLNLMEAVATGLMVVASDNRGHRDIAVKTDNIYLFDVNSKESYFKAIDSVIERSVKHHDETYSLFEFSVENAISVMAKIYMISSCTTEQGY